jgi:NodT family efflux transporter outer membrane factor (OMF) lipoprotein
MNKPHPVELQMDIPESFKEARDEKSEQQYIEEWWKVFDDPVLNDLMDRAFSSSFDLKQAFARLEQLEALSRSAAASRWPFLNIEGQYGREKTPGFFGDNKGDSYRLSLSAGYEIDVWQKLKAGAEAASLEAGASLEDIKAVFISLSAQLADLYYFAAEQRAQLELYDRLTASFEDTLDRVESRYREGLVPAIDVYQSRQSLAGAQAGKSVFESNLAVTEHALAILLGRYPGRDAAGKLATLPAIPDAFPTGLPSGLLARRPDVQAVFLRLKASDERIASAIADRFPAFNLLGSYGRSSTAFSTGDISGIFWNVLVSLAQPVLDGGRRSAEVDRSRAIFKENLVLYHGKVLAAFQEVEDALAKNRADEERLARTEEKVRASRNAHRLAVEQYMQGLTDYLPVLAAQQLLFNSESAVLSVRRQMVSDRILLARALGGEWMDEAVEDYLQASKGKEDN